MVLLAVDGVDEEDEEDEEDENDVDDVVVIESTVVTNEHFVENVWFGWLDAGGGCDVRGTLAQLMNEHQE